MNRRLVALTALAALTLTAGCIPTAVNTGAWDHDNDNNAETDPQTPDCLTHETGYMEVTTDNAVINRLCLDGGTLEIRADNVTVKNSVLTGDLDNSYWTPLVVNASATGTVIKFNDIDCAGDVATDPTDGSTGLIGANYTAEWNEIRNCENGVHLGANVHFLHNWIGLPDTDNEALHADGVQMTGDADDFIFEWNTVDYPLSSAAFQFHTSAGDQNENGIVRYNRLIGGASVLRVPGDNQSCQPPNPTCGPWDGNQVHGNRIMNDEGWFFCTGNPTSIEVWGTEAAFDVNGMNGIEQQEIDIQRNVVDSGDDADTELVWSARSTDGPDACELAS